MGFRSVLYLLFEPIYWVIADIFAMGAKEREYSSKMKCLVIFAIAVVDAAFYYINPYNVLFVFSSILSSFLLIYYESKRVKKSLVLALIWTVVGMISELIGGYSLVAFIHATMAEVSENEAGYCAMLFVARLVQLLFAVMYYRYAKRGKTQGKSTMYWLATSFTFVGSIVLIILFYYFTYDGLHGRDAYWMMAVVLIILCMNLMLFFLYERQEKFHETKDALIQMEHYIDLQRQFYEAEKEKIEKERIERHDLRNYMLLLEYAVEKQDWELLGTTILQKFRETESYAIMTTGNEYLDVILTNKLRAAAKQGIQVYKDILMKEILKPEQPLDLIALIGNAMDNAIEAAGKCEEGKIELRIMYEKGLFRMLVRNSMAKIVEIAADGTIPTTKKEQGHGYGIRSMKLIAEKYAGNVELDCIDGMFELSVLVFL